MNLQDAIKRMKRQAIEWDKILANHLFDNRFASRICREFSSFDVRKTNIPVKKMGKCFDQTLHQRRYTEGKTYEEMLNLTSH